MGRTAGTAALAIALTVGTTATCAAAELDARVGAWGGTWAKVDKRDEVRIDAASAGEVTGTFCGVRIGDGSVLSFDFDAVDSTVDGPSVKMNLGRKYTYWVTAAALARPVQCIRRLRHHDIGQGAHRCTRRTP